jgi:trypsin
VNSGAPQTDACQGDSGGPLTAEIGAETVLVGLVSQGKGCGTGTPSIYTNVSYFLDWISAAKLEPAGRVSRW